MNGILKIMPAFDISKVINFKTIFYFLLMLMVSWFIICPLIFYFSLYIYLIFSFSLPETFEYQVLFAGSLLTISAIVGYFVHKYLSQYYGYYPLAGYFSILSGLIIILFFWTDTYYAPGYSHWGFSKIKVGMKLDEVEKLVGKNYCHFKDTPRYSTFCPPYEDDDKKILHWSLSPGDTNFYHRFIYLEKKTNRVAQVHSYFYGD